MTNRFGSNDNDKWGVVGFIGDFVYWSDDGSVAALRDNNWKLTFLKQNAEAFEELRFSMFTNLPMEPFGHGVPGTKDHMPSAFERMCAVASMPSAANDKGK
jgi:hypothetical protein